MQAILFFHFTFFHDDKRGSVSRASPGGTSLVIFQMTQLLKRVTTLVIFPTFLTKQELNKDHKIRIILYFKVIMINMISETYSINWMLPFSINVSVWMYLKNDSAKKKKVSTEFWYTHRLRSWCVCVCVFSSRMTLRVVRRWPHVQAALLSSESSMTRSEFLSLTFPPGFHLDSWRCVFCSSGSLYVWRACGSSSFCPWKETGVTSVLKTSLSLWFFILHTQKLQKPWGDVWTDEFVNVVNVSGDAVRFYSLFTADIGLFFHYVFLGIINQFQSNQNQPLGGTVQPIFTRFDDASCSA